MTLRSQIAVLFEVLPYTTVDVLWAKKYCAAYKDISYQKNITNVKSSRMLVIAVFLD